MRLAFFCSPQSLSCWRETFTIFKKNSCVINKEKSVHTPDHAGEELRIIFWQSSMRKVSFFFLCLYLKYIKLIRRTFVRIGEFIILCPYGFIKATQKNSLFDIYLAFELFFTLYLIKKLNKYFIVTSLMFFSSRRCCSCSGAFHRNILCCSPSRVGAVVGSWTGSTGNTVSCASFIANLLCGHCYI